MRFAADENFNGPLLKKLIARIPGLDVIRIQDTDRVGSPDHELLEWLAEVDRILLTHDVQTIPKFAYQRIQAGLPMPGIIEVNQNATYNDILNDLEIILQAGQPEDFNNKVIYI